MAIEIQEQEFDARVLKASKPVLVDFYADWCGPCVQQTPILEKWAKAKGDAVEVVRLDVDKAPAVASRYGIMSIPTLVLFNNGEEAARAIGLQSESRLDSLLNKVSG